MHERPPKATLFPASPQDPAQPLVSDFWCRSGTRFALFALHLITLGAALACTPPDHAVQLGYYAGFILLFGCFFLWILLYHARIRSYVALFGVLAVAQVGYIAAIGLEFRRDDRIIPPIIAGAEAELVQQQEEWERQVAQTSVGPLLEMLSGKGKLSAKELVQLRTQVQTSEKKLEELNSERARCLKQTEYRLAAVSPVVARDFRRAIESRHADDPGTMRMTQDFFTRLDQLIGFLIERQGQYRVTTEGLRFDKPEDEEQFNKEIDAIGALLKGDSAGSIPVSLAPKSNLLY